MERSQVALLFWVGWAAACGRTSHDVDGDDDSFVAGGKGGRPSMMKPMPEAGSPSSWVAGAPAGIGNGGRPTAVDELAGAAGQGAAECDAVVPTDFAFVDAAIAGVTPPATVCLEAGVFGASDAGPIYLRDGVSVRGVDLASSVLCGRIEASAAQELGVSLEQLGIAGVVHGQTAVKLTLRSVAANHAVDACPADAAQTAVELHVADPTRTLELTVEDTLFFGPGVLLATQNEHVTLRASVQVRRSQCSAHQCWDFARFELGSLTPESRVDIRLENNLVDSVALQAVALHGHFPPATEGNSSTIQIVNNTFYAPAELNYGIFVAEDFGTVVVAANNAIGNIGQPIVGPVTSFGNVVASQGAEAWFESRADFTPSETSPLRGSADYDYLPAEDIWGRKRTSNDVGAVAYH